MSQRWRTPPAPRRVEGSLASLLRLATLGLIYHPHGPPFLSSGSSALLSRPSKPCHPAVGMQCFSAACPTALGTWGAGHYPAPTSASTMISLQKELSKRPGEKIEKGVKSSAFVGIRRVKDADTKAILTSAPTKQGLGMGVAARRRDQPGPRRPRESGRAPARGWRARTRPPLLAGSRLTGLMGNPGEGGCLRLGLRLASL
ncbi:unnamed protein product [Rangifer tarandus platyrhynchus]|uniref:Uncharacterized protein n=1 Tax=Rangifer tarandus platyrhynchus TaxID=3082113 RepID=A0AC59Z1R2_RANTA